MVSPAIVHRVAAVRPRLRFALLAPLVATVLLGCTGDDDTEGAADGAVEQEDDAGAGQPPSARFCDEFLEYLAEPSGENLQAVTATAGDPQVNELALIIDEDDRTGRVLAADSDLRAIARDRCQAEWVGAAQGGGDTAGAAQAFFDAVVAGDPIGARNVASANAIAVFEPWTPVETDAEAGTPALLEIGDRSFSMALGPATIAECGVEFGVIIACTVAR